MLDKQAKLLYVKIQLWSREAETECGEQSLHKEWRRLLILGELEAPVAAHRAWQDVWPADHLPGDMFRSQLGSSTRMSGF